MILKLMFKFVPSNMIELCLSYVMDPFFGNDIKYHTFIMMHNFHVRQRQRKVSLFHRQANCSILS